jgi:hypothetical protein
LPGWSFPLETYRNEICQAFVREAGGSRRSYEEEWEVRAPPSEPLGFGSAMPNALIETLEDVKKSIRAADELP